MFMPASSAAWIVAMLSSRSAAPYEPDIDMAPRLRAETAGPVVPRFLVCMFVLPYRCRATLLSLSTLPRCARGSQRALFVGVTLPGSVLAAGNPGRGPWAHAA